MSENTGKIQESNRFKRGHSGNPSGRPVGSKNKATLIADQLFLEDLQGICESVIAQARSGNMQAAKIIFDRLVPPKKDRPISIKLPKIQTAEDILKAVAAITQSIANGEISPSEGEAIARILDIHAKAIELHDFEKTLNELKEQADIK